MNLDEKLTTDAHGCTRIRPIRGSLQCGQHSQFKQSAGLTLRVSTGRNPHGHCILPYPCSSVFIRGELFGLGSIDTIINPNGIVDAAAFQKTVLAPGGIISIFGRNLARAIAIAPRIPLPTTLGSVSLTADGQPIPLFFASGGQINAQLPYELTPGTVRVVARITSASGGPDTVSLPVTLNIGDVAPGIFAINSAGSGQGAILNGSDFTLVAPEGTVRGAHPATPGDVVVIFCTGLGRTNPLVLTGQAAPRQEPLGRVVNPAQVTIGGISAEVLYAGLTPGFVGLYQINVRVPAGVTAGDAVPVVITQKGVSSNTVTMAVR